MGAFSGVKYTSQRMFGRPPQAGPVRGEVGCHRWVMGDGPGSAHLWKEGLGTQRWSWRETVPIRMETREAQGAAADPQWPRGYHVFPRETE